MKILFHRQLKTNESMCYEKVDKAILKWTTCIQNNYLPI